MAGDDLVGHELRAAQIPAVGRAATGCRRAPRPCEPAVELPADPVGDGAGRQCRRTPGAVAPPQALEALAVLGLGGDEQAGAGACRGRRGGGQLVGQAAGDEGGGLDPLGRRVELGAHGEVGGRRLGGRRALVAPGGQAVGDDAVGAEAAGDVAGGQGGDGAEGAQPEPAQHVDQLVGEPGEEQVVDAERGEEGGL